MQFCLSWHPVFGVRTVIIRRVFSGVLQAAPLGYRDGSAELPGSVDPEADRFMAVRQRLIAGVAVDCAARKLRHLGHKDLIFLAPINDDLIPMHQSSRRRSDDRGAAVPRFKVSSAELPGFSDPCCRHRHCRFGTDGSSSIDSFISAVRFCWSAILEFSRLILKDRGDQILWFAKRHPD